jgi:putative endonuclease
MARKSFSHVPGNADGPVFYVYVLRSEADLSLYIGYTSDLKKRLTQHKKGAAAATSHGGPWKLIYYEAYVEQADALGRERYLKSGGGRRFLRAQSSHYLTKHPSRQTAG